jgi:hypothetical protein
VSARFFAVFALLTASVLGPAEPSSAAARPRVPLSSWTASTAAPVPAAAAAATTNRFVPVTPTRVLDTRSGVGAPAGPLTPGGSLRLRIVGSAAPVPTGATAVVLNLTVTEPQGPTFVTVYPDGDAVPTASSLNIDYAGQTVANLVTVRLGSGAVRIFSQASTHLVADVAGYYVPSASSAAGRLVPTTPTRLLDTRSGPGRTGALGAGEALDLDVARAAGLPADAAAVVLNLTATEPAAGGFLSVTPKGAPLGRVSNLNIARPGQTIANQVIVPLQNGAVTVFAAVAAHVVIDLGGWYTGPTSGTSTDGLFVPLSPGLLLDTRDGTNSPRFGMKPAPDDTIDVTVGGRLGAPASGMAAVVVNATATATDAAGFLTLFAAGLGRPLASNLNADLPGQTVPNHAIVPVSSAGASFYTSSGAHLIVDLAGYFTGSTPPAPNGYRPSLGTAPTTGPHNFLYRMADGSFARWDPCSPITYKVNYSGAPPFARSELARAVAKLEAVSGLDLVDTGETTGGNDRTPPPGTKVVISFVSPAENPGIASVAGLGGGAYYPPWNGLDAYVAQGFVHINETLTYSEGTGPTGLEGLLLHELGHMIGLDHVDSSAEVMYPTMHNLPYAGYGPGDRQGLWSLGVVRGCLNTGASTFATQSLGDPGARRPVSVSSPQAAGRTPVLVSFCGIAPAGAATDPAGNGPRWAEVGTSAHPDLHRPAPTGTTPAQL